MTEIHELSALELAAAYRSRELSPIEVVDHALDRVATYGERLGAFVTVTDEAARSAAKAAERAFHDGGELPTLFGVPTAIKDLDNYAGVPTSFGSAALRGFVSSADDSAVGLLRAAGLISLGKTSAPEFGLTGYTETAFGPPAATPWDLGRSAGGSSGGAAAVVSARLVPMAQGSDGGGSIRTPASACGIVGFKPSRHRVPTGPGPASPTALSTAGPMARNVRDAAAMLDVLARPVVGELDRLPTESFLRACELEPGRLRIARWSGHPAGFEPESDVIAAHEAATAALTALGHEIVEVPTPLGLEEVAAFQLLWAVGAATIPTPPGVEDQLQPITRWLRSRGREVGAVDYVNAVTRLRARAMAYLRDTADCAATLTPCVAQVPRPHGWYVTDPDGTPSTPEENFRRQLDYGPYTPFANLAGLPSVSMPLFLTKSKLPVGAMLTGRPGADAELLTLAAQLESTAVPLGLPAGLAS